jgi:hypothetical protein
LSQVHPTAAADQAAHQTRAETCPGRIRRQAGRGHVVEHRSEGCTRSGGHAVLKPPTARGSTSPSIRPGPSRPDASAPGPSPTRGAQDHQRPTRLLGLSARGHALRACEAAAVRIEDHAETLRGHCVLHRGKGNDPHRGAHRPRPGRPGSLPGAVQADRYRRARGGAADAERSRGRSRSMRTVCVSTSGSGARTAAVSHAWPGITASSRMSRRGANPSAAASSETVTPRHPTGRGCGRRPRSPEPRSERALKTARSWAAVTVTKVVVWAPAVVRRADRAPRSRR